jgi:hypothetical protein
MARASFISGQAAGTAGASCLFSRGPPPRLLKHNLATQVTGLASASTPAPAGMNFLSPAAVMGRGRPDAGSSIR